MSSSFFFSSVEGVKSVFKKDKSEDGFDWGVIGNKGAEKSWMYCEIFFCMERFWIKLKPFYCENPKNIGSQKMGSRKFGLNRVRYCWYGQMSPGQMLHGLKSFSCDVRLS